MRTPERAATFPGRPERLAVTVDAGDFAIATKPLSNWETVANNTVLRKFAILVVLALIWELYARRLNNALLVPTFSATVQAFITAIASGELLPKVWVSIKVLLVGYSSGIAIAAALTTFATTTRIGNAIDQLK